MSKNDSVVIDFGTSNTTVRIVKGAKILNPIANTDTNNSVPSAVYVNEKGLSIRANRSIGKQKCGVITDFKRLLGKTRDILNENDIDEDIYHSKVEFDAGKNPYFVAVYDDHSGSHSVKVTMEEAVTAMLKYCKQEAEARMDKPIEKCVLTIPNYCFDTVKRAMKRSARAAGLTVDFMIKEPTSAGISYLRNRESNQQVIIHENEKLLIFDFGGGTLDLSVVKREGNSYTVLGQGGNPYLGGNEVDSLLCDLVMKKYQSAMNHPIIRVKPEHKKYAFFYGKLRDACRVAKEELSYRSSYPIDLSDFVEDDEDSDSESVIKEIVLSQLEFNDVISDLMKKAMNSVVDLLNTMEIRPQGIQHVLLVGGSSRIPDVKNRLNIMFKNRVIEVVDPQELVVKGATIAMIEDLMDCRLEETLDSALAFKLGDIYDQHLPVLTKIPTCVPKYYDLSSNGGMMTLQIYRKVNNKWQEEKEIDLRNIRSSCCQNYGGRVTVKIDVSVSSDTTVEYSVMSADSNEKYGYQKLILD